MANTLDAALAAQAKAGPKSSAPKYEPDSLHRVPVELLDDNPWQPRTTMDERELTELVDSVRVEGLIQPIAVKPRADGRFTIVAGHRRVAAFKRLLEEAATESARQKFSSIAATMKVALDDAQLAAQAYMENVTRAALTPLDEARALENMVEKGLARTNEDLAALLQQPAIKIKRLRRLTVAPAVVKDAVAGGLMVVIGADEAGKEKKELRKLELMSAIAFVRVFEHLKKEQPKKAEERTEAALRRALAGGWSLRRCEEYAQSVVDGREATEPSPDARAPLFAKTLKKFAIDLVRLKGATAEELTALQQALAELLVDGAGSGEPKVHQ